MRDNGNLEVMTLPDFTLKYVVPHFPLLPKVLTCAPRESWASDPPKCSYPEGTPTVSEILMVGLGGKGHGRRPLLMARLSDHEVAIYQAYPFYENCHRDKEGLKVQFKKIPHKLLLRERKAWKNLSADTLGCWTWLKQLVHPESFWFLLLHAKNSNANEIQ